MVFFTTSVNPTLWEFVNLPGICKPSLKEGVRSKKFIISIARIAPPQFVFFQKSIALDSSGPPSFLCKWNPAVNVYLYHSYFLKSYFCLAFLRHFHILISLFISPVWWIGQPPAGVLFPLFVFVFVFAFLFVFVFVFVFLHLSLYFSCVMDRAASCRCCIPFICIPGTMAAPHCSYARLPSHFSPCPLICICFVFFFLCICAFQIVMTYNSNTKFTPPESKSVTH